MKYLLVIGGATATGKTALSILLARHFGTAILSADSRQFYQEMSIGTAKPTAAELAAAPHHFIDNLSIADAYSVGAYEHDAMATLETLFQEHDVAILVGGSGLYIKAVCEGLDSFPDISEATRARVESGETEGGLGWLQQMLGELDPEYFKQVDQQNPARLRRAVEVCLETGQPYSSFRTNEKTPRPFKPIYLLLDMPRTALYARIEARVDQMVAQGLEAEVRALVTYREHPALKTVGYEEFFQYFDGALTYPETIDKIKQHSRNYAKRQATWFRKHGEWKTFQPDNYREILRYLEGEMAG